MSPSDSFKAIETLIKAKQVSETKEVKTMGILELIEKTQIDDEYDLLAFSQEFLEGSKEDPGLLSIIRTSSDPNFYEHMPYTIQLFKNTYDNTVDNFKKAQQNLAKLAKDSEEYYHAEEALKEASNYIIQNTKKRFEIKNYITVSEKLVYLFEIPAYWDYLKYKALLEEHHQQIETNKLAIDTKYKELQQNKLKQKKENTKQLEANLKKEKSSLDEMSKKFEAVKKDFKQAETEFLKAIDNNQQKEPSKNITFQLEKANFQYLTQAKSIMTGKIIVAAESISDIANKFNPLFENSLPKYWNDNKKFSRYTSDELIKVKEDYIETAQVWIDGEKDELRRNTQPKGLVENVSYFFNRVLFGKKIPKNVANEKAQLLEEYQKTIDSDEAELIDAMLGKLELADKMGEIGFDDTLWYINNELSKLKCGPYNIISSEYAAPSILKDESSDNSVENIIDHLQTRASHTRKPVMLNPGKYLTPEIAAKFRKLISEHVNKIDQDPTKSQRIYMLNERLKKLKMSHKPADWEKRKFEAKGELEQSLVTNPAIWLAINSLTDKFTEKSIAEAFQVLGDSANLLGSIDNQGNLYWLKQKEALVQAAQGEIHRLQQAAKQVSSRKNPEFADMVKYISKKLDSLKNDLKSNKELFTKQIISIAHNEIDNAINMRWPYGDPSQQAILLRQLANQLVNANTYLQATPGNTENLNLFPQLLDYMKDNWLDIPVIFQNVNLLINTFGNDEQQKAFKLVTAIVKGVFAPSTEESFKLLEEHLSPLFAHIADEKERSNELQSFIKSLTEKYVYEFIRKNTLNAGTYNGYPSPKTIALLDSQIKFLTKYSPNQLDGLKTELHEKISNEKYEVINSRYHLAYALIANPNDLKLYATKRFRYLIEHRKEQTGVLQPSDRWLFNYVKSKNDIVPAMITILKDVISQSSDHKLDTAGENDQELVNLAFALGDVDIILALHEKVLTQIHHVIANLSEEAKKDIKVYASKLEVAKVQLEYYLRALISNGQKYLNPEQKSKLMAGAEKLCEALYQHSKLNNAINNSIKEFINEKPVKRINYELNYTEGQLNFYQQLYNTSLCALDVLQDLKVNYLLKQIHNHYISDTFALITNLLLLEEEFGESNANKIYEALKMAIAPEKSYAEVGSDLIEWCSNLLSDAKFANTIDKDKSLYKRVIAITAKNRIESVSLALAEHILKLLRLKQYEDAAKIYGWIKEKDYTKAIDSLPENELSFILPEWQNINMREEIVGNLTKLAFAKDNIIYDKILPYLQPKFLEFIREQFTVENLSVSTQQKGVEQMQTEDPITNNIPRTLTESAFNNNEQEIIDSLNTLIRKLKDPALTDETKKIISGLIHYHERIYQKFLTEISAGAELAGSDFNSMYGFKLNSFYIKSMRDLLSADEKSEVSSKIEEKMRRLEGLLTDEKNITHKIVDDITILEQQKTPPTTEQTANLAAWNNFASGIYKNPCSYALKAASNLILGDNKEHKKDDTKLIEIFPDFYSVYVTLNSLLANPNGYLDNTQAPFDSQSLDIVRNFINSHNRYAEFYKVYINEQINLLIEKKAAALAILFITKFGSKEQIQIANEQLHKHQQKQLEFSINRINNITNLFQHFDPTLTLVNQVNIQKDAQFIMQHGTDTQQSWLKLRLERLLYLFLDINANNPNTPNKEAINKYIVSIITGAYVQAFGQAEFDKAIAPYLIDNKEPAFYQEKWATLPIEYVTNYFNEKNFPTEIRNFDEKAFGYLKGKIDKDPIKAEARVKILYSIRDKFIKYGILDDAALDNTLKRADKNDLFTQEELHELGVSNEAYTYNRTNWFTNQADKFQRKVKTVLLVSANVHRAYHSIRDIDASEIAIARQKEMIKHCINLQKKHYKEDESSEFYKILFKAEEKENTGKVNEKTIKNYTRSSFI